MSLLFLVVLLALCGGLFSKSWIRLGIFAAIAVASYVGFSGGVGFWVIGVIELCLLLGQPLFVLMGLLSVVTLALVTTDSPVGVLAEVSVVIEKILELASKEVLLAIPFFVIAGEVMTQGSLAQRLIDVARAVFGWLPGGLAVAGVAGCIFFAAISGSSPVTVIAIGSIMVPALLKAGYPEDFAMGLFTTAGSLGILIPPSIPMIVYSIMVGATTPMDPTDLFLAGVVPGALIGGMLAGYSVFIGFRHKLSTDSFSIAKIIVEAKRGFWSLMLPVIILGGIYSGVFTTTEAAAVSVVYALLVELFIHGELKVKDLPHVAENSMAVMGALFLIIALAIGLNHVLVLQQVPERMVEWLQALDLDRTSFLLMVNGFLLLVGCFMDIMSAILIIAPMLAPMSVAMGIDPIHMGIIFIVNLEIGYCTPPVGLNLFVASTLFDRSLGQVIKAVITPLLIMAAGLLLVVWVPVLSTGLGRVLDGKPLFDEDVPAKVAPDAPETPEPEAPPEGVKTLQELMQGASPGEDDGDAPEVKSLQELMQESNRAGDDDAKPAAGGAGEEKVKTLQELMQESKRAEDNEAADDAAAEPAEEGRVKTLQELMQEAK